MALPGVQNQMPASPRPLSEQATSGTLPHSARGLEHLPRPHTGSDSTGSVVSHEHYPPYKPPSTIPEESSAGSPFNTPGRECSPLLQNPDSSYQFLNDVNARDSSYSGLAGGNRDFLTAAQQLSPLRANPSHPDLVPQPLALVKRNSTLRTPSAEGASIPRLRRSYSDATAGRGCIRAMGDSEFGSPSPLARKQTQGPESGSLSFPIPGELPTLPPGPGMAASATGLSLSEVSGPDPFSTSEASLVATQSEAGTATSEAKSRSGSPRRGARTPRPFYESEMGWRTYH